MMFYSYPGILHIQEICCVLSIKKMMTSSEACGQRAIAEFNFFTLCCCFPLNINRISWRILVRLLVSK